jgi:hypothetical protein
MFFHAGSIASLATIGKNCARQAPDEEAGARDVSAAAVNRIVRFCGASGIVVMETDPPRLHGEASAGADIDIADATKTLEHPFTDIGLGSTPSPAMLIVKLCFVSFLAASPF